ncbi:MAG: nuclease-related domain-containing protein [Gammaproteobacteria bacterium]|nr:nuclease-related domain-containing protein [Gammaproteobacteria bacterium]
MEKYAATLVTSVVFIIPLLVAAACLQIWHWYRKRKPRRSPLTRALLRSPGESLRQQIDDLTWDIAAWLAVLMAMPLLFYAMYLSQLYLAGVRASPWIYGIVAIVAFFVCLYKLITIGNRRRYLRQGLDGELATGQELTELLKDGMSVFHDVQCERFNIDHVVIGSAGVFAVETKARAKLQTDRGKAGAGVKVDGDKLLFPNWTETRWVEQARRQAQWLANWLKDATGERIDVKAVLALPGWYVEVTKPSDVFVFNPRNPRLLTHAGKSPLSEDQVRHITSALEHHCRDVKAQEV